MTTTGTQAPLSRDFPRFVIVPLYGIIAGKITNKNPVGDRTGFVGMFAVFAGGYMPTLAHLALGGKYLS